MGGASVYLESAFVTAQFIGLVQKEKNQPNKLGGYEAAEYPANLPNTAPDVNPDPPG